MVDSGYYTWSHQLLFIERFSSDESWYSKECCCTIFPFNFLSDKENVLAYCTSTDSNIIQWKDLEHDHGISVSLKPFSNLEFLVSHCSNATPGNGTSPEKIYSSENYDIKEMHDIEIPHEFHTYAHIRADLQ